MISLDLFTEKFKKMVMLCNFPKAMLSPGQIEVYHEEFRRTDEDILLRAFRNICNAPPVKLTAEQIWRKIYDIKPKLKSEQSDWTGIECDIEGCNRGLICERIGKYDVLFRCTRCRATKIKGISDHTPENIQNEKQKHAPVYREENKIETLVKDIG